jgi:hypothetical protein
MKKYGIYILLIVLLAAAGGWFGYNKMKERAEKREGEFAYSKGADIYKVVLTDLKNNKLELELKDGKWIVNNKYEARTEQVQALMEAVTRMESLAPVSRNAHENVLKELAAENTKVQVYIKGEDEPVRTYLVGGPTLDSKQTYMLNMPDGEPAKRPHMVFLPGFRGYLTARFITNEEQWRSRIAFSYKRDDIKALSVTYPTEPERSFVIERLGADSFSLSPGAEQFRINEFTKQNYIRQYLDFYTTLSIETYDNEYSKKDSLKTTVPYSVISVTDLNNKVNKVTLYRMPIGKRSKTQFDDKGNELTFDLERFYAWMNGDTDFAIAQYYVFGNVLRSYQEFYYKPAATP